MSVAVLLFLQLLPSVSMNIGNGNMGKTGWKLAEAICCFGGKIVLWFWTNVINYRKWNCRIEKSCNSPSPFLCFKRPPSVRGKKAFLWEYSFKVHSAKTEKWKKTQRTVSSLSRHRHSGVTVKQERKKNLTCGVEVGSCLWSSWSRILKDTKWNRTELVNSHLYDAQPGHHLSFKSVDTFGQTPFWSGWG